MFIYLRCIPRLVLESSELSQVIPSSFLVTMIIILCVCVCMVYMYIHILTCVGIVYIFSIHTYNLLSVVYLFYICRGIYIYR